MKSRIHRMATLLAVAAIATTVSDLKAQEIAAGAIVTAKATVHVYRAPPEGAFYKKGELVDSTRTGDRLRVVETRRVTTLTTHHLWLRVELLTPTDGSAGRRNRIDGWVYSGPVGGESNFQIAADQRQGSN